MANQEGTRDTSGVTGNPGPIPLGTQHEANVRDTSIDGDAPQFSGPFADPTPAEQFETSSGSGYGLSHLSDYSQVDVDLSPVDTSIRATMETFFPGTHHINRQYNDPAMFIAADNKDTSWTDVHGVGYNVNREIPLQYYYATPDTYSVAAGAAGQVGTQDITLDADTPVDLTQKNIFPGSLIVKTDAGGTTQHTQQFEITEDGGELTKRGVIVNSVAVSATVDDTETVTLTSDEQPVDLTTTGILTDLDDIVVKQGSTVLTAEDDYVLSETGAGETREVSIAWVDGGALPTGTEQVTLEFQVVSTLVEDTDYELEANGADSVKFVSVKLIPTSTLVDEGDLVVASYETGGFGYFRPERLVEGIDYVSERTTGATGTTTTIHVSEHVEARVGDGDAVTVSYLYGSLGTYNSRRATSRPNAVTAAFAFTRDRGVEVQWNPPAGGEAYEGFLVEVGTSHSFEVSDNDGVEGASTSTKTITASGMIYTSGNVSSVLVGELEPDRHHNMHDPGHEGLFGTYKDYKFRVAAVNHNGVGDFSPWTSTATSPMNYDAVPPSSIPRSNRVNPIYRADGSIVPGTGIGG